jgi:hypothetical protein
MLTATQAFLEPLEKWVKAVRAHDYTAAKRHAEHLIKAGELLIIHPDFKRCFQHHCHGCDPHEALLHTCQMLLCATDGREKHMRDFVDDRSPTPSS